MMNIYGFLKRNGTEILYRSLIPFQIVAMPIVNALMVSIVLEAIDEAAVSLSLKHVDVIDASVEDQTRCCHLDNKWILLGILIVEFFVASIWANAVTNYERNRGGFVLGRIVVRFFRRRIGAKYTHSLEHPCRRLTVVAATGDEANLSKASFAQQWFACLCVSD